MASKLATTQLGNNTFCWGCWTFCSSIAFGSSWFKTFSSPWCMGSWNTCGSPWRAGSWITCGLTMVRGLLIHIRLNVICGLNHIRLNMLRGLLNHIRTWCVGSLNYIRLTIVLRAPEKDSAHQSARASQTHSAQHGARAPQPHSAQHTGSTNILGLNMARGLVYWTNSLRVGSWLKREVILKLRGLFDQDARWEHSAKPSL